MHPCFVCLAEYVVDFWLNMSALALSNVLPMGQAVLAGAVDSVENVAINIFDKIGIRFRSKDLDKPLTGKVAAAALSPASSSNTTRRFLHLPLAAR